MMGYDKEAEVRLQREVDEFWRREGGECVTSWVDFAIHVAYSGGGDAAEVPIDVDEIPLGIRDCEACEGEGGEDVETADEFGGEPLVEWKECEDCEGEGTVSTDVFEWWNVGSFLAKDLRELGAVVIDGPHGAIWGRETTGQAICLDEVIRDAYRAMKRRAAVLCGEVGDGA